MIIEDGKFYLQEDKNQGTNMEIEEEHNKLNEVAKCVKEMDLKNISFIDCPILFCCSIFQIDFMAKITNFNCNRNAFISYPNKIEKTDETYSILCSITYMKTKATLNLHVLQPDFPYTESTHFL